MLDDVTWFRGMHEDAKRRVDGPFDVHSAAAKIEDALTRREVIGSLEDRLTSRFAVEHPAASGGHTARS